MTLRTKKSITTVVFDLDDTLYDCYGQRVLPAHRRACRALLPELRAAGWKLALRRLLAERLRLFHEMRDLKNLDRRLLARLGVRGPQAVRLARIGRAAHLSLPVRRLKFFPDTLPTLRRLQRRGIRIFIVTAGYRTLQSRKVRLLGLDRSPYVRRIFYARITHSQSGKEKELARVLDWEPDPQRILVVGDRPNREIRAANELGMVSVRRLGGEFAAYQPASRKEKPQFTIRQLGEIFRLGLQFAFPPER